MRPPISLAPAALALLMAACGGAPSSAAPPSATVSADPAAQARLAMAAGDWQVAADHLRGALRADPHNLELHYRLGVCASRLNARAEAIREFEWVLAHGAPGSEEARIAGAWLAETQSLGATRVAAAIASPVERRRGDSALSGIVTWSAPGQAPRPRPRQVLLLIGLDGTPTTGLRYRVRSARDGRYEFKDVVAGPYTLTDTAPGPPTWRLRVVLETGRDAVLDLSADNGTRARAEVPETPGRSAATATPASSRPLDDDLGSARTSATYTGGN